MRSRRALLAAATAVAALLALHNPAAAGVVTHAAQHQSHHHHHAPHLLASGMSGGSGSTVGPDGALYVTDPVAGEVLRVSPRTGASTTYASGLPTQVIPLGGAMDVAFVHHTAYVLVTLVGPDVGGTSTVGLYRIDSATTSTVVADIGSWAIANPPATAFEVPSGVQYALQPTRHGLLVTDGHHNRVLMVDLTEATDNVSEVIAFDNIVPTGMATRGRTVYLAQAGPVPHLPENGRIVTFRPGDTTAATVASGAPLLVDVEFGTARHHHGHGDHRGHRGHGGLYALSQGTFHAGDDPGSPAMPDTGSLLRVNHDGMTPLAEGLDRPTSMEIIGGTAYVVTLDGEIWTVRLGGCHPDHEG